MAYTLSNLLKELMNSLGQTETFLITGGTTTTVINSKIGERPKTPSDNYAIDGFVLVTLDAGLAGAAPENEYRRISAYDSATWKYTVDTPFSVSPVSGDEVMIISPRIPLRDVIACANRALQGMLITLPDVTLVTVAGQQTYSLPTSAKMMRPRLVEIQQTVGDVDTYQTRTDYDYKYTSPGTAGSIQFEEIIYNAGLTIRIYYDTPQPSLTAATAVISETITPAFALATCKVAVLEWLNSQNGGTDDYWMRRENMARDELSRIEAKMKISKPQKHPRLFVPPFSGYPR